MSIKRVLIGGIAATTVAVAAIVAVFQGPAGIFARSSDGSLVDTVRAATGTYQNVEAAKQAGYGLLFGCVSGPDEGAMGIHFVNGSLVDGTPDAAHPEALLYEFKGGQFRLTGVEYIVVAADWDTAHPNAGPPVLDGQVFDYTASPNRYRIPAVYTLHVWAWKHNPNGTSAMWNPNVSCDDFTG